MSYRKYDSLSKRQQNIKSVRAIGKTGTQYLRFAKAAGNVVNKVNIVTSGLQICNDYNQGRTAAAFGRAGVLAISSSAYFIPVIGPAVSAGIGIAEVAYGEQFYNYLEERFDE